MPTEPPRPTEPIPDRKPEILPKLTVRRVGSMGYEHTTEPFPILAPSGPTGSGLLTLTVHRGSRTANLKCHLPLWMSSSTS